MGRCVDDGDGFGVDADIMYVAVGTYCTPLYIFFIISSKGPEVKSSSCFVIVITSPFTCVTE